MLRLRCPATGQSLAEQELASAEDAVGPLAGRPGSPFGRTPTVLVRADGKAAYPITDGIAILLTPEALTTEPVTFDLRDPRWAEAYDEMEFYNASKADVPALLVQQLEGYSAAGPLPSAGWLDSPYDGAAQLDAFDHLGPVLGQRVAQLGGSGVHAVKSLLSGAAEAWLITPMYQEACFGAALAQRLGVSDRFKVVVGIGEQIPFEAETFDVVYSGGCLHHMTAEFAGPQIRRVLVAGGRFAAVEPWQTALHRIGTRVIGKREANPYCRPLNPDRVVPLQAAFRSVKLAHHGPLLRYLALAVGKLLKFSPSPQTGLRIARIDDALPLPARFGGSVAVLATR